MATIKKFPNIAILFGILALVTGVILLVQVPRWINIVFAIFWFGTGLLGLHQGMRAGK